MSKIADRAARKFLQGQPFSSGNTRVVVSENQVELTLHGNTIAWRRPPIHGQSFFICMQGWPTVTTRDRLNALPQVWLRQKQHAQFLDDQEIGPYETIFINNSSTGAWQ